MMKYLKSLVYQEKKSHFGLHSVGVRVLGCREAVYLRENEQQSDSAPFLARETKGVEMAGVL